MNARIIRASHSKDNPYSMLRKAMFEDNRLSLEARGMLGYILVKPDDWQIQIADLMKQGKTGRDRVYRIINELIGFGYIDRIEVRNEQGKVVRYDYFTYEEPLPEKPYTENQDITKN
jgi:hypothetical protein